MRRPRFFRMAKAGAPSEAFAGAEAAFFPGAGKNAESAPVAQTGGGMFGGRARGILRREDGDPGTFLNYLLFGRQGVEGMREGRMNRDLFGHRIHAYEQEQKDSERTRADTEAAIATLDPTMQPWARLAPEAAAREALDEPDAPETEYDSATGNFYRINPTTGGPSITGRMPGWQPPASARGVAPPSGYRFTADGNLEAIPGGPSDIRQSAEGRARADQLSASEQNLNRAIAALNQAEPLISGRSAGVFGSMTRDINQRATDLDAALEPVRAILSFETLAEMRRNSTTGGALGSIAVRELELLGATYEDLRISRSPEALRQAVRRLRTQLTRTRDAVSAARREAIGMDGEEAAPEGGGNRLRWNPETGALE